MLVIYEVKFYLPLNKLLDAFYEPSTTKGLINSCTKINIYIEFIASKNMFHKQRYEMYTKQIDPNIT